MLTEHYLFHMPEKKSFNFNFKMKRWFVHIRVNMEGQVVQLVAENVSSLNDKQQDEVYQYLACRYYRSKFIII